jgi:hypothetical protein
MLEHLRNGEEVWRAAEERDRWRRHNAAKQPERPDFIVSVIGRIDVQRSTPLGL